MSGRHFDVSGTQVVASVLATITGAIAASYLGVAGTIIGAAVMSVASTAGSAIYKDYLGRTGHRLRTAAPVMTQRAHGRTTVTRVHGAGPSRTLPDGRPGDTMADHHDPDDPRDATAAPGGAAERDEPDAPAGAGPGASAAGRETSAAGRGGWRHGRPRWLLAAIASAGIFVGVIAGITVFELAAGKPLAAVVWQRSGSGTSLGGGNVGAQTPAPPRPTSTATPKATPSAGTTSPSPGATQTSPASPSPSSTSSTPSPSPSPSPSSSATQGSTPAPTRTH